MKILSLSAAFLITAALIGCKEKGNGEKAGQKIDQAIDNVKHGDSPFKEKGALEKAGERIDDSVERIERKNGSK